jgi:hypothetical protein
LPELLGITRITKIIPLKAMSATVVRSERARRFAGAGFGLLVFSAALAGVAGAQETTLRSQSNVVLVPALVKDAAGEIVYGLQASDFVIEDEGVEQAVRLDETPEAQPISLVLAIQKGRRAAYELPRMQGLKSMLDPLFAMGTTHVAVVEFDS